MRVVGSFEPSFTRFAASRGMKPLPADLPALVELFVAFYADVPFKDRAQGTLEDMLLFQTSHTPGSTRWSVGVLRQLYRNGRGVQLGVDLHLKSTVHPRPEALSLWSEHCGGVDAWRAQALHTWTRWALPPELPWELKVMVARF